MTATTTDTQAASPAPGSAEAATAALRPYRLADNLAATSGVVFLTGTQALVRLLLMQRDIDDRAGLRTAGFVSGYRGSPLGMVDQQLWKARARLDAAGVQFLPAINEDLGATACLGVPASRIMPGSVWIPLMMFWLNSY